jgi:D-3-phosphoglycerate dehydrogenase / 2-oxoglutarate reductase
MRFAPRWCAGDRQTRHYNLRVHIVIADSLPASAADALKASGWSVDAKSGRKPDELARALTDADALIVRSATQVTADLLAAAPRLRVVARAGTGVDNVDVPAATARGILVMNAAGANSISVAEHALALMLSLARSVPMADATMKRGVWDKKKLTGVELRGKLLGIIGFGRIGREVAARARAFGMEVVAYDPFIPARAADAAGVPLIDLDELLARADFITLHVPALPETRHLINAATLAKMRKGVRIVNTARGELIDEKALAEALESGHVAGAGLDVFETEPPADSRLTSLPQVVATPHIAASTTEAQELVGTEIAINVRDYLQEGIVRNAVNFPAVPTEDVPKLRPYLALAERLGALVSQLLPERAASISIRYYGPLMSAYQNVVGSAVLAGALSRTSESVTAVNARALADQRGLELLESRSTRPRDYVHVVSVKIRGANTERWVEGTVVEPSHPRLSGLDGVPVEAPLSGTLIIMANEDRPGVVGGVGTALGRAGVNIASFALGRNEAGAVGVIGIDEGGGLEAAVGEIMKVPGVKEASVVRLN